MVLGRKIHKLPLDKNETTIDRDLNKWHLNELT